MLFENQTKLFAFYFVFGHHIDTGAAEQVFLGEAGFPPSIFTKLSKIGCLYSVRGIIHLTG